MCGIAGIISHIDKRVVAEEYLHTIMQAQTSRGPDNNEAVSIQAASSSVYIAHNRLKIIDLSNNANQPMQDDSGRYILSFNGEIYNYRELKKELIHNGVKFHTNSDTEVLLKSYILWGEKGLEKINGMFAFAFYDKKNNLLSLVRDRFGQKPLYYTSKDNLFCFASNAQGLANVSSLTPNLDYLSQGIKKWVYEDNTEQTQYKDLKSVLPGHIINIRIHQNNKINVELKPYYHFHNNINMKKKEISSYDAHELKDIVSSHLKQAVNHRLRADVPVGIALSGGLDSSIIAAIANNYQNDITAFCFGNPLDKSSEAPIAKSLAARLDIDINYIQWDESQLLECFWDTLRAQQSPFSSLSIVAQNLIYQNANQAGVKVILGGQGGDELFLGYRKFWLLYLKNQLANKNYSQASCTLFQMLKILFSEFPRIKEYYASFKRYSNHSLDFQIKWSDVDIDLKINKKISIEQRQVLDVTCYSLPTLLRYDDRNSMAHSVESRLPLLDYQLAEYAVALPVSQKLHKGYGKWILRSIADTYLSAEISKARYKRGFDVPLAAWLSAGLDKELSTAINSNLGSIEDFLHQKVDVLKLCNSKSWHHNRFLLQEAISCAWLAKEL